MELLKGFVNKKRKDTPVALENQRMLEEFRAIREREAQKKAAEAAAWEESDKEPEESKGGVTTSDSEVEDHESNGSDNASEDSRVHIISPAGPNWIIL